MSMHNRITFLIILGLCLLLAAPTRAQQAAEAVETHDEGPSEGVRVSGVWTFEIYEPDGRLVEMREVHNALHAVGQKLLGKLLLRTETTGGWIIQLLTDTCSSFVFCDITEPASTRTQSNVSKTLQLSSGPADEIVLDGSYTASSTGQITIVRSVINTCASATAPDQCPGTETAGYFFTEKILSTPIDVQTGQQVAVRVVLGFN